MLSIAKAINTNSPGEELAIAMFVVLAESEVDLNRERTAIAKPVGIRQGTTEHEVLRSR